MKHLFKPNKAFDFEIFHPPQIWQIKKKANQPPTTTQSPQSFGIHLLQIDDALSRYRLEVDWFLSTKKSPKAENKKQKVSKYLTSWWFQPIWKILVKLEIFRK